VLLLLSLLVMHYGLHYKMFAPTPARGQNTTPSCSGRAGATPRNFGWLKAVKSGVAPARFSVFPAVTFVGIAWLSPTFQRDCSRHRLKNLQKTEPKDVVLTFFTASHRVSVLEPLTCARPR